MANGLTRVQKYARLDVPDHLQMIDNDLDLIDYARIAERAEDKAQLSAMQDTLHWISRTFIALLVTLLGVMIALVVTLGH